MKLVNNYGLIIVLLVAVVVIVGFVIVVNYSNVSTQILEKSVVSQDKLSDNKITGDFRLPWKKKKYRYQPPPMPPPPVQPTKPVLNQSMPQFQTVQYLVSDNNSSSPRFDLILLGNIEYNTKAKVSSYGYTYEYKLNGQITRKDLEDRVTVFVYNDKAMIIVGDKSPANQILLAGEISIYLASIGTIVKSSKIFSSSQVKDDDLVKAINSFCGNNFCESGEDQTNCPNDCPIIKTVNCITPQQVSSQNSWQVDKDITLCPGRYDLLDDVSIVKDGIVLDCGGAELRGVKTNPRTLFLIKANNVNIKNCNFANIGFTTAFVNGIVIENNNFDHWTSLGLITSNSLIKNNDVNGVLLWSPGATTPPLQNNRFINNNIRGEFAIADSYNNEIVSNNINNLNIARISGNVIKNNRFILNKPSPAYDESGLHIIGGNNNSFENNEIIKNMQYNRLVTAIDLINSQNNKFSKNIIRNFDKGIVIDSTSQNNEFKNNNLINNQLSQIIDNSAAPNIYLNNFITGFSDDPQKCNDLNNDNICDNPFVISAGLQDSKPSKIPN